MAKFKVGDIVLHKNDDNYKLGKIKAVLEDEDKHYWNDIEIHYFEYNSEEDAIILEDANGTIIGKIYSEFEDELFEPIENDDIDFDIELEKFLEEYGFELTQIDNGVALFENDDVDFDINVNLKDNTFDGSIMPYYIKQGIEELGYTAYNDEESFETLGPKED